MLVLGLLSFHIWDKQSLLSGEMFSLNLTRTFHQRDRVTLDREQLTDASASVQLEPLEILNSATIE